MTSEDHKDESEETTSEDPIPGQTTPEERKADRFSGAVMSAFFKEGKLVRIPAKKSKRMVVLERLLTDLKDKDVYHEREVNEIIRRYHDDVATIRREFIMNGYMTRKDGYYKLTKKGIQVVA